MIKECTPVKEGVKKIQWIQNAQWLDSVLQSKRVFRIFSGQSLWQDAQWFDCVQQSKVYNNQRVYSGQIWCTKCTVVRGCKVVRGYTKVKEDIQQKVCSKSKGVQQSKGAQQSKGCTAENVQEKDVQHSMKCIAEGV